MAERFVTVAWARIGVPYDRDAAEALLLALINGDDSAVFVTHDRAAMMGAVVHGWHFNPAVRTATELFWWAEPSARGAKSLIDAAERWAASRGARTFNMASQHHMRSPALGRVYERLGYAPSEHVYIKEIG